LALRRLILALEQYSVAGLHTNIDFLIRLASHKEFQAGNVHTGFIPKHFDELGLSPVLQDMPIPAPVLALAKLAEMMEDEQKEAQIAANSFDPLSPWHSSSGFRMNHNATSTTEFNNESETLRQRVSVTIVPTLSSVQGRKQKLYQVEVTEGVAVKEGKTVPTTQESVKYNSVVASLNEGRIKAVIDGVSYNAVVFRTKNGNVEVILSGKNYILKPHLPTFTHATQAAGSLNAPMHGKIVKVYAKSGTVVKKGDPLIILEAMKMEHLIPAPKDGKITGVFYKVGDIVENKAVLISIE